LRQTLRQSKEALEQCIGAPVLSFVPPFDMPQDYPARLAFNLTERREARSERTDLPRLGAALAETGYRFCRLAYRPFYQRGLEKLAGRRLFDRLSQPEQVGGVVGLRVNTPPGFGPVTQATLDRLARGKGYLLIYGHPHHLTRAGHPESEAPLRRVLAQIRALRAEGVLRVAQPREVF
jgi:peptidoglycan/xylan/chitin deacetylase (PgdA/CDA1 family)